MQQTKEFYDTFSDCWKANESLFRKNKQSIRTIYNFKGMINLTEEELESAIQRAAWLAWRSYQNQFEENQYLYKQYFLITILSDRKSLLKEYPQFLRKKIRDSGYCDTREFVEKILPGIQDVDLSCLPPQLREIIDRIWFKGDDPKEIATDLGMNLGNVYILQKQALAILKNSLNE